MTLRIFGLLCLGLAAFGELRAQSAGVFSQMGFGARGLAMSNALVADASGSTSPYYNPALAPFMDRQNLEASYAFLSLDRELQFLQFATPLRPRAGIAAGLIHAGVSNIDGRNANGEHTQLYSTRELAFFLAFGTRLGERVSGGLAFQLYRATLFEEIEPAVGIGLDLGLTVRVTDALRLGLAADDLLAKYDWDTSNAFGTQGRKTTDRFPTRLRFGAAYALPGGRGTLSAEYESRVRYAEARIRQVGVFGGVPQYVYETSSLRLQASRLRLGGEYWLVEPFALRAGVDDVGAGPARSLTPSAGFAVRQDVGQLSTRVDYAFALEPYGAGTLHLLSLRLDL